MPFETLRKLLSPVTWTVFQPEGVKNEMLAGGRLDPQGVYGTVASVHRREGCAAGPLRSNSELMFCHRLREENSESEEQAAPQYCSQHSCGENADHQR